MFREIAQDYRASSATFIRKIDKIVGPLFFLGFYVCLSYRIRAPLYRATVLGKFLSLTLGMLTSILSACYLSPKSRIQGGLVLPHPVGVVVGDGVVVGRNVRLFQNVTLGSRFRHEKSYPVIGNGVTVFPNSIIVGAIDIGDDVIVGAGSIVLKDVPRGARVAGNPARVLHRSGDAGSAP